MEFREIKRVVRDHGGVAELLIQPTPLHQFEGGRGGVAPVSAGAHAALRSVARFIYMMCRRAGSYRPACGVSPATQAPPPLSAPPPPRPDPLHRHMDAGVQGWTSRSFSGPAIRQGCMTTLHYFGCRGKPPVPTGPGEACDVLGGCFSGPGHR
jgi:hypothetical protein